VHRNSPSRRRARRGTILIETLIALVLLGFMGAGMVSLLAQTLDALHGVRPREAEIVNAAATLSAIAAWSRQDLEAHAGRVRTGGFVTEIRADGPSLFDVAVRDSLAGRELLSTTLYRPEAP